jgi:Domain of unknown function (DUF4156)
MKHKLWVSVILLSGLMSACTWVKPTPQANNVHVVGQSNIGGCERLGWVEVAVRSELLFDIQRSPAKVKTELETLARNQAAKRGADSVMATSDVQNGKQLFDIYRCR